MTIAMYQSSILASRRPRPYGLIQALAVERYGEDVLSRWIAGVDAVSLEVELLTGIDLTACDPPASGDWDLSATPSGGPYEFRAFSSIVRAQCTMTSGPDTLDAMVANVAAEHEALLPSLLEKELVLGTLSGSSTGSLSDVATGSNPTTAVAGTTLIGHAEHVSPTYESLILVPLALFAGAAEHTTMVDGVLRTKAGNIVVPQAADANVYVVPTEVKLHLTYPEVSPGSWAERSVNRAEAQSTVMGLFEFRSDEVVKFDPTP